MPFNDDNWEDLLFAIEDGHVVPIVGAELLQVETASGPKLFHRLLAERLAQELKVPPDRLPPDFDTNAVVCAYQNFRGDPLAVRPSIVRRILDDIQAPPPEPLCLLAGIPELRLFVSTSFDTLLESAIASVRGRAPATVAFPPASNLVDYDDALLASAGSVVFQLFGRATASSEFAITEGQVLEQMHELVAGDSRPRRMIAQLQQSDLLFLGVGFPDWLGRFLLRVARKDKLWSSRTKMEVIADGGLAQPDFVQFLRRFSPQYSHVCDGVEPAAFVRELHRRYFERHPKGAPARAIGEAGSDRPAPMNSGSIFISYAHEDHVAAFRLADELTKAGLEVWIDRRLQPGADFKDLIVQHIRECCAFVPLISRSTQGDDPRWFRQEWAQAVELSRQFFGTDRGFLFPVVIDATPSGELVEMRRNTFARTAVRAPDGSPPPDLIDQLDRAQKDFRRRYSHA